MAALAPLQLWVDSGSSKRSKTRESKTEDPNWKQALEPVYQKLDI